jgi:NAD(P)-dependent dehydrogenase (short-subunit alcohol dehydrogenase family)
MTARYDMTGKVALVTGAASGLGRATAAAFAEAGARLCLVDYNEAGLHETAGMLPQSAEALVHVADLSEPEQCKAPVEATVERFGTLDALCNVAGVIYLANTPEMPLEQWNRTIAVNLTAPFLLCQAAIPHLLESEGAIVNVTSLAEKIGEAYAAAYCASKAGLLNPTRGLAMEYLKRPIRINAVAPGGMATNIAVGFRPPEGCDFELLKRYSPIRGLVEVERVADVILMLASDAGRGFHGASLVIDEGITAG